MAVTSVLKAIIEGLLRTLYKFVATGNNAMWKEDLILSVILAPKHVF